MLTPDQRLAAALWITRQEMRLDKNGNPMVYSLPANDGGGAYEVAGLNERYHRDTASNLARLIQLKRYDAVWSRAAEAIADYTDAVAQWGIALRPGEEAFLRDTAFNRGPKGAARVLQIAVFVSDDGIIGNATRAAYSKCEGLLPRLRLAREIYEYRAAGYRSNFWKGLTNRWNNAYAYALGID